MQSHFRLESGLAFDKLPRMNVLSRLSPLGAIFIAMLCLAGCAGSNVTAFVHDEYNFEFVERVAIVPLDNLSDDRGAGARATQVFLSELLSARAFEVVEPGEVTRVLSKFSTVRTSELTTEQIVSIGKELKVQGLFLGSVNESSSYRSGGATVTKVSLTTRLVETEQGLTVWSASATAGGRGFWASLFGTGDQSTSEVTRSCVRKLLGSLFK
jgi:TolB-like protein